MEYNIKIQRHYEEVWENKGTPAYWYRGPVDKLNEDFTILEFEPTTKRNMWTYATCCMSSVNDDQPIELHIFSIKREQTLVELMTAITYYHINGMRLDLHHTFNFGRSWQDNSLCTYGFISLPYLDGPDLEDGPGKTKFYWLIPVTESEVAFKKVYGAEKLESKFEEHGLDYVNSRRKTVV